MNVKHDLSIVDESSINVEENIFSLFFDPTTQLIDSDYFLVRAGINFIGDNSKYFSNSHSLYLNFIILFNKG